MLKCDLVGLVHNTNDMKNTKNRIDEWLAWIVYCCYYVKRIPPKTYIIEYKQDVLQDMNNIGKLLKNF